MRKAKTNFGNKLKSKAQEIGIININVCPPVCWSVVPSWLIPEPEVDLCILNNNKRKKSGDIVKEVKSHLQQEWSSHLQIYIDGSKDPESIPDLRIKNGHRISDQMSVFTAEKLAILCALWWVEDNKPAVIQQQL